MNTLSIILPLMLFAAVAYGEIPQACRSAVKACAGGHVQALLTPEGCSQQGPGVKDCVTKALGGAACQGYEANEKVKNIAHKLLDLAATSCKEGKLPQGECAQAVEGCGAKLTGGIRDLCSDKGAAFGECLKTAIAGGKCKDIVSGVEDHPHVMDVIKSACP